MKILVIEDDDVVRTTLIDMLKHKQYTAEGTATAEEALAKLPGDFDLVISDILLDGMDGVTLLNTVTRMNLNIPVLMITGYGEAELEDRCKENGAAGFLKKPFTVQTLLEVVERAVKKKTL